jgi:hypothetical protein
MQNVATMDRKQGFFGYNAAKTCLFSYNAAGWREASPEDRRREIFHGTIHTLIKHPVFP